MIPKKVKVGGIIYRVSLCKKPVSEETGLLWGEHDPNKNRIRLKKNSERQRVEVNFVHELVHAINDYYDIKQDEETVIRFSHGLYQVLRDNKLCFKKQ